MGLGFIGPDIYKSASIIGAEEEASEWGTLYTGINLFTACLVCLIAWDVLGWVLPMLCRNYKLCRMPFVGLAPRWGGCWQTSAFLYSLSGAARLCQTGALLISRASKPVLSQKPHGLFWGYLLHVEIQLEKEASISEQGLLHGIAHPE